MNLKKIVVLAGTVVLLSGPSSVMAAEPSVELGRRLFSNPGLSGSTNGMSCSSCHPRGEKLGQAWLDNNLNEVINRCITGPLGGKSIDIRGAEMRSLKMYIESLTKK